MTHLSIHPAFPLFLLQRLLQRLADARQAVADALRQHLVQSFREHPHAAARTHGIVLPPLPEVLRLALPGALHARIIKDVPVRPENDPDIPQSQRHNLWMGW